MSFYTILLICASCMLVSAEITNDSFKLIKKIYNYCDTKEETFKCFKIQALKAFDKAVQSKSLNLFNGISLIDKNTNGREFQTNLNKTLLEKLNSNQIDGLLLDTVSRFYNSRSLKINVSELVEEGRNRRKDKHHGAALLWALAIKGSFLAMAYKGIAIMAGTALIVGKMALLLSAILGLKKLVSGNKEKTTFEIVKHPKYSETHSHASSYEDEGHYRRSLNPENYKSLKITPYREHI